MPRKRKQQDDRRDEIIRVRLTGTERDRFERRAAVARRKPSDFARDRLLGGPVEVAGPAAPFTLDQQMRAAMLAEQIRKVGVNLNQWVRRMNELGVPPPAEAVLLLPEIRELVRRSRTAL